MKRPYVAQILRIEHDELVAFLNIDLGFRTWHVQNVNLVNMPQWRKFANEDWVNVNIYQHKDPLSVLEAYYSYDAVVVSEAKEPRSLSTE